MNTPSTSKKIYCDNFYFEQVQETTWIIFYHYADKKNNNKNKKQKNKNKEEALNKIQTLAKTLTQKTLHGRPFFTEIVPGFESILVETLNTTDRQSVIKKIQSCLHETHNKYYKCSEILEQSKTHTFKNNASSQNIADREPSIYTVPICYDSLFALDKKIIEEKTRLTFQEIIERHTQTIYTIQTIGFMPGFAYMGDTPEALHLPRKTTPNTCIPQNSLAIAENKTAIYPSNSPGGWYILGRTPLDNISALLMDKQKMNNQCNPLLMHPLLTVGQQIQFYSISLNEYNQWKQTE